ncbi:MAG: decaprenyl-phosphate phosphoribosyltransferase [Parachlamydiaceae bacterium]
MNHPRDILKLMRPLQWIKNGFVFVGILFGSHFGKPEILIKVIGAAAAFCLASSAVYIFNDIIDKAQDLQHPKKRNRPLPSGKVSIRCAIIVAITLFCLAIATSFLASTKVLLIIIAYSALNIAYSMWLKHIVILDVFCIAAGFMLRILAGTIGVGIPPSRWLLLCSLMVTLFLGFAKRRAEVATLADRKVEHRRVLLNYTPDLLDLFIGVCVAGVILTYSLYTMSLETISLHHTENLIYTVPFVIYALFRYIFILHNSNEGGDPTRDLLRDPHIMLSVAGWALLSFYLI